MERGGRNGNSNGGSPRPPPSAVAYRVKVVGQPRTLTCRIDPGAPVSALRIAVVRHIQIEPADWVRLVVGGRTMKDALRVRDYQIDPASTVIRAVVSRFGVGRFARDEAALFPLHPFSPRMRCFAASGPRFGSPCGVPSAPPLFRVPGSATGPGTACSTSQRRGEPSKRQRRSPGPSPVTGRHCAANPRGGAYPPQLRLAQPLAAAHVEHDAR